MWVLVRDLTNGWAKLHEDEVWASTEGMEGGGELPNAFVLVDGRPLGLQRFFRVFSKDLED